MDKDAVRYLAIFCCNQTLHNDLAIRKQRTPSNQSKDSDDDDDDDEDNNEDVTFILKLWYSLLKGFNTY